MTSLYYSFSKFTINAPTATDSKSLDLLFVLDLEMSPVFDVYQTNIVHLFILKQNMLLVKPWRPYRWVLVSHSFVPDVVKVDL